MPRGRAVVAYMEHSAAHFFYSVEASSWAGCAGGDGATQPASVAVPERVEEGVLPRVDGQVARLPRNVDHDLGSRHPAPSTHSHAVWVRPLTPRQRATAPQQERRRAPKKSARRQRRGARRRGWAPRTAPWSPRPPAAASPTTRTGLGALDVMPVPATGKAARLHPTMGPRCRIANAVHASAGAHQRHHYDQPGGEGVVAQRRPRHHFGHVHGGFQPFSSNLYVDSIEHPKMNAERPARPRRPNIAAHTVCGRGIGARAASAAAPRRIYLLGAGAC